MRTLIILLLATLQISCQAISDDKCNCDLVVNLKPGEQDYKLSCDTNIDLTSTLFYIDIDNGILYFESTDLEFKDFARLGREEGINNWAEQIFTGKKKDGTYYLEIEPSEEFWSCSRKSVLKTSVSILCNQIK